MSKLSLAIATFLYSNLFGQINMNDSTVQVVGYWLNNEKQSFDISFQKYRLEGADTLFSELIRYQVDVTIRDSTATNYLIEWRYKNFSIETNNKLSKKISSIAEDMSVLIKTDEFGTIQEVVNWEDVRDYIQKAGKKLKRQLRKIPNKDDILAQVLGLYQSKEAIESNAIKDARQFYTFHGGKYFLGQKMTGRAHSMNAYGGKPFDIDITVSLDEIDVKEGNSVIRMYQAVDSKQLTDATYDYLTRIDTTEGDQLPSREEFPPLTNETWTASRIHGNTGWIIYSVEKKYISAEGAMNVEERIIQLK